MKNLIILFGLLLISVTTFAQKGEKNVPMAVKTNFQKKYPAIKDVKWDKENENYEANFSINKVDNSVLFNEKGDILETEVDMAVSELPAKITLYIKNNYKGKKIKEAAKITTAKGELIYEAEVGGMDLQFDSAGKYLKTVKD